MKSRAFLEANARNRQTRMRFSELGGAKLWEIKQELRGKKIATTSGLFFFVLKDLKVETFSRVTDFGDPEITYKRVCPVWDLLDNRCEDCPDAIKASKMPTVEGIKFRY